MAATLLKCFIFSTIILSALVSAQGRGNGISKYTRGQSDPRSCLAFFEKFLGANETNGDCTPDGKCECATQGRSQISDPKMDFGLHAINCSFHPYGEHSLADIEEMQTAEVNDFKDGYNQHLDSHLGVWVSDLSATISALNEANHEYYGMTWKIHNQSHYSVMTQACGGFYIEFLSRRRMKPDGATFHEVDEVRFDFTNFTVPKGDYHPIKVSRATTKISEMVKFFTETIGGVKVRDAKHKNGLEVAVVRLDHAQDMVMQFVNRPAPKGAKFTVKDLEDYHNKVHDEYIKSHSCGFDQFADHHWAYDAPARYNSLTQQFEFIEGATTDTLSSFAKKLDAGKYKYRWFSIPFPTHTGHQIYAVDPSGWTFQLDYPPGDDVPDKVATYSPDCKSDDGCAGQGLCDSTQGSQAVETFTDESEDADCGHLGDPCTYHVSHVISSCCNGEGLYCGKNGEDSDHCNIL